MTLWISAIVDALRRLPDNVQMRHEEKVREQAFRRLLEEATKTAKWICPFHGDAYMSPDGMFHWVQGGWILPMSKADAEDFHGFVRVAA